MYIHIQIVCVCVSVLLAIISPLCFLSYCLYGPLCFLPDETH